MTRPASTPPMLRTMLDDHQGAGVVSHHAKSGHRAVLLLVSLTLSFFNSHPQYPQLPNTSNTCNARDGHCSFFAPAKGGLFEPLGNK